MKRALALIAMVALAGGCEIILGIEDPNTGVGEVPPEDDRADAGLSEVDAGAELFNPLGILCGPNHLENGFDGGCPGESACITQIANFADPELSNGYCSPRCFGDDFVCEDGYSGPADGVPACFITREGQPAGPDQAAELCAVGCFGDSGDAACPEGMVCLLYDDGAGNTLQGCGGPSWVQQGL